MIRRAVKGYRIEHMAVSIGGDSAGSRRVLRPLGTHYERYAQLPPKLYADFARLSTDEEIVEFADQHGELGLLNCLCDETDDRMALTMPVMFVDLVDDWYKEINEMREMVEILEALDATEFQPIARLVRVKLDIKDKEDASKDRLCYKDRDAGIVQSCFSWEARDLIMSHGNRERRTLALKYHTLARFINRHLKKAPHSLALDGDFNYHWNTEGLLAGMWIQVAEHFVGRREHEDGRMPRPCVVCGDVIEGRGEYCGKRACYQKAYRERKKLREG